MQAHSRQCVTAVTPVESCYSYRCAVTQHKCTADLFKANCNPHCSVLLWQTGSQQALFDCSHTCGGLLSSYWCAVTHHECTAALFRAKCNFCCSMLLCKTASQQAVCHCNYTYGHSLLIQVCSDPAQVHCSTAQGKMQLPLFCAAL